MPEVGDFPPERHVGRDLQIAYRLTDRDRIELTIPVVKEILRPESGLDVQFLSSGRIGPFRTRATRRYDQSDRAIVWHTQTVDAGEGGTAESEPGRVMTRATVTTAVDERSTP
jgi:hypothetical protein